jgi:hypothetical protein
MNPRINYPFNALYSHMQEFFNFLGNNVRYGMDIFLLGNPIIFIENESSDAMLVKIIASIFSVTCLISRSANSWTSIIAAERISNLREEGPMMLRVM